MRFKLIFILLAGLAVSSLPVHAQVQQKFGFIDMQRVFRNYDRTREADQQLKQRNEEINAERRKLIDKYNAYERQFKVAREEADSEALSMVVRAKKRNEAEDILIEMRKQREELEAFQRQRLKELEDIKFRMRRDIVDEINDLVEEYAIENAFTIVIDVSGETYNRMPLTIYRDPKYDITDEIIALLNRPIQE